MDAHDAVSVLKEVLLFLALAGVLIPLLGRLKINPVLGFLAVGTLLGPTGLAQFADRWPALAWFTFARSDTVQLLAELGVIFLMFMIGLEMSVDRLWSMRRQVFGLGGLQVALTAVVIGTLAWQFGNPTEAAVLLGTVLAFSSTAIVMQLLVQRRELGTPLGQASFAILLFQDLAVVPLLVLTSILGSSSEGTSFALQLGSAMLKGVFAVVAIYLVGRRLIRPLFHQVARTSQPDTFTAVTLLTTLGVAALTSAAGLSMALGAMLAGLIIAETEFRHEVEVTIEPFKGLLMGLFFLSVGMGIDVGALLAHPIWMPLAVAGLLALKAGIVFVLLRAFGLSWGRALEGGLLLGQGGEFAFIVIGLALGAGLFARDVAQFMLIVVSLSMLVAPVAARLGQQLGDALDRRFPAEAPPADSGFGELRDHVLIAGYGRVGQMVGQMLAEQGATYVGIEHDARLVARMREAGVPLTYGDASHPELLRRLHVQHARAVVLTMDQTAAALNAVKAVRRIEPHLSIFARARDEKHALILREAGASVVVPETLESSLQLTGFVLESIGMPGDATGRLLEQERERRIVGLRGER
jgi:CPA2 family monovalent cation:H+ antiporter-2